jgi:hypothetical protein
MINIGMGRGMETTVTQLPLPSRRYIFPGGIVRGTFRSEFVLTSLSLVGSMRRVLNNDIGWIRKRYPGLKEKEKRELGDEMNATIFWILEEARMTEIQGLILQTPSAPNFVWLSTSSRVSKRSRSSLFLCVGYLRGYHVSV